MPHAAHAPPRVFRQSGRQAARRRRRRHRNASTTPLSGATRSRVSPWNHIDDCIERHDNARTWFVGEQLKTSSLCTVRVVSSPAQLRARALWAAKFNANGLTTFECDTAGVRQ